MAVTHSGSALAAATDAVTTLLSTSALLKFRATPSSVASPGAIVADLTLEAGVRGGFTAANGTTGIATQGAIGSDTNADGGTIAFASLQTSGNTIHIHCAVSTTGSDINITTGGLTVTAGDTVAVSALTYKAINA